MLTYLNEIKWSCESCWKNWYIYQKLIKVVKTYMKTCTKKVAWKSCTKKVAWKGCTKKLHEKVAWKSCTKWCMKQCELTWSSVFLNISGGQLTLLDSWPEQIDIDWHTELCLLSDYEKKWYLLSKKFENQSLQ